MKVFKKFLDFYINSSIHVALSVFAFVQMTYFMFNILDNKPVAYFAFLGTIVGYNFVKYDALARAKRKEMRNELKVIAFVSFLSLLGVGFYFFQLQWKTQIVALLFLVLIVLYTLPFFPNKRNARNWKGLKIYIVALCWVGVTLILPVINAGILITSEFYLKCIQRFILVFVLILIFEIIDLKNDDPHLQTVPQQIGVKQTKLLGYCMLFVFCLLEIMNRNFTFNNKYQVMIFLSKVIVSGILSGFMFFANEKKSKYYTSFWVESLPIFWWILVMIFH
jgi:hypothetical protein